ncbi:ankyrin repeat-containing domain protein [Aspergillus keveii]|uniref:Ankyrin repeat-containing domain protein n=1 Tax=Aspergillus keveii TaxID=714993 RepID=A0ABR4GAU2_9EURO
MLLAASFGHEHIVALLYEKGCVDLDTEGTSRYAGDVDSPYGPYRASDCTATPLVCAIIEGHEKVVRVLLELGANPNCPVPTGYRSNKTPMGLAAIHGNPAVLKLLIEAQIEKNVECAPADFASQLERCLYLAARADDCASVQVLLEAGARPSNSNVEDPDGLAKYALNCKNLHISELLIQNGYVPTMEQLCSALLSGTVKEIPLLMQYVDFAVLAAAAACGNLPLVRDLIVSRGWKVDGPAVTRPSSTRGRGAFSPMVSQGGRSRQHPGIPLICAAQCGQLRVVEFLLAHGANPWGPRLSDRNRNGPTSSLAAAVRGGDAEIVSLLLDHGVDPNAAHDRETVLFDLIKNEAVFKVLLDGGMDFDLWPNYDGNPLTSSVVRFGTGGVARLMCERGVDFDHPTIIPNGGCDRGEYTLGLMELLAQARDLSVLHALMDHGGFDPRPDHPNAGRALLEAVIERNIFYLRFLLFERGFDPRALAVESDLVFFAAARASESDAGRMLDILLEEKGLDIEALDCAGQTPLLQAVQRQMNYEPQLETVRLLLSRGANPIFQCPRAGCEFPLMVVSMTWWWDAKGIIKDLCNAIEERKISFDEVKPQLLRAMEGAEGEESKGIFRILRRLYWRGQYPVQLD